MGPCELRIGQTAPRPEECGPTASRPRLVVGKEHGFGHGAAASLQDLVPPAAAAAIVAPVAWLCWQRGGVDPAACSAAFGVVLALAGLWSWCAPRVGAISLPWPVALLVLLPVLQLAPLGLMRSLLWQPSRQDLQQAFAQFGVEGPSSISLYPLATLQAGVVLAGCCAMFVTVRAILRRCGNVAVWVAAALLAVAVGEATLGLSQTGWQAWDAPTGGVSPAGGTFVNRNHFAVLLEAGFCLALGLAAFLKGRMRSSVAGGNRLRFGVLASWLAAGLCLTGLAASGSRMGLLVGFAAVVVVPIAVRRNANQRSLFVPASLLILLVTAALSFAETAEGFAKLLRERGDPGRIAIWADTLAGAAHYLPAGSGLGTFRFAFRRSEPYFLRSTVDHAHNDWLEFLVELGLPGALLLAASIAAVVVRGARRAERDGTSELRPVRAACVLAAVAILPHASVDFPLQIPALAALLAVLLGCADGLACGELPRLAPGLQHRFAALACWAFALTAVAMCWGRPASWDAAALAKRGQQELLAGRDAPASIFFRASLEANPFAAGVWLNLAEATRMSGDEHRESGLLDLASRLEPFTFRTEWPAAQSLLRRQLWEQAAQRLRRLARDLPDTRPAVYRAALQAGMPVSRIVADVVPRDAAGTWLRVLADQQAWEQIDQTLAQWPGAPDAAAAHHDLRYVFDRLFQAGRQRLMMRLWQTVSNRALSVPHGGRQLATQARSVARDASPLIRAPELGYALPGPGRNAEALQPAQDPFAFGFGFQWTSRLEPGVGLCVREISRVAPHIEFDFRSPAAGDSVRLSRYFVGSPETEYVLDTQFQSELAGGELRLEVWSAARLLGCSPPMRRAQSWRSVRFPFRTEAGEQVLQLRVVSRTTHRKPMRGMFLLQVIRVRTA